MCISSTFNFTSQGFFFSGSSFLHRDARKYLSVGCFLISRIFCVRDLQHIAKWFILSQFLQIFPFCRTFIKFVIFVALFTSRRIRCLLWILFPSWVFCDFFPFPFYRIHWVVLHFLHLRFDLFVATGYFDVLYQTNVFSKLEFFR